MRRPPLCWSKKIDFEKLEEEIVKATSIGAKSSLSDTGLFALAHYQIALNKQKKWKEVHEKIAELQKPVMPSILQDHKWNYKVYGKSGKYTIYLDGKKMDISDEQAEEIERYITADREYYNRIKEIKNEIH